MCKYCQDVPTGLTCDECGERKDEAVPSRNLFAVVEVCGNFADMRFGRPVMCELPAGHAGRHQTGRLEW